MEPEEELQAEGTKSSSSPDTAAGHVPVYWFQCGSNTQGNTPRGPAVTHILTLHVLTEHRPLITDTEQQLTSSGHGCQAGNLS